MTTNKNSKRFAFIAGVVMILLFALTYFTQGVFDWLCLSMAPLWFFLTYVYRKRQIAEEKYFEQLKTEKDGDTKEGK